MAEEEIVIRIVADDSELIASLNNIAGEAEGLEGVMNDVSENISEGFDVGAVEEAINKSPLFPGRLTCSLSGQKPDYTTLAYDGRRVSIITHFSNL